MSQGVTAPNRRGARRGTRDEKSMSLPSTKSVPFRLEMQKALKRRSKLSMLQILKVMEENKVLKAEKTALRADATAMRESRALYKSKVKDLEREITSLRDMLMSQKIQNQTKETRESGHVPELSSVPEVNTTSMALNTAVSSIMASTEALSSISLESSTSTSTSAVLTSTSSADALTCEDTGDATKKNLFKGELFKGIKTGVAKLFRRMSKSSQDSSASTPSNQDRRMSKVGVLEPLIPCGNYTFISIFDRRCRHCRHLKKHCEAAAKTRKLRGIDEVSSTDAEEGEEQVDSDEEEGEAQISIRKLQACLQTPDGLRALRKKLDDQQRKIQGLELGAATRDLMVQNADSVVENLEAKMKQTLQNYEKNCTEMLELRAKLENSEALLHSKTLENIKLSKKLSKLQSEFDVVESVLRVKEEHLKSNDIDANRTIEALQQVHQQSMEQCKQRFTDVIEEERRKWKETEISLRSNCATKLAQLAQAKLSLKHMSKKYALEERMKQLSECHIMQLEDHNSRNYELELLQEKLKALLKLCGDTDSDYLGDGAEFDLLSALPEGNGSQLIDNVLRSIASPNAWAATPSAQPIRKLITEQLGNMMKAVDVESLPEWVPDRDAQSCSNCLAEFSTLRRRHHCRHCGECFCQQCSDKTFLLSQYVKEQRVCDGCFYTLSRIHPNRKSKPATAFALSENDAARNSKLALLYPNLPNWDSFSGDNSSKSDKEMVPVHSLPATRRQPHDSYSYEDSGL